MQQELKAIREEIGFSIAIMAEDLGIHKATYQGYETGRRKCPPQVLQAARRSLQSERAFWSGMDARITAKHPNGVISAPVEGFN